MPENHAKISRFGPNSKRGRGFQPIFFGLMNLHGRFRSGDYALLMDGTSPQLATAQLAQKPSISGFLASVRCRKGTLASIPKFLKTRVAKLNARVFTDAKYRFGARGSYVYRNAKGGRTRFQ